MPINPKPLLDMNYAFAQTALLVAAVRLRIFTHIANGAVTLASLVQAAQTAPEPTRRLLKGLEVLGLVERSDEQYHLTPLAEQFLVEGKPSYLGGDTLAMLDYLPAWLELDQTVRTRQPFRDLGATQTAEAFFAPRVLDLFHLVYPLATRLATALDLGTCSQPLHILDVGAGSAAWSIAFAQRYPTSHVTAIDLPAVAAQGRKQVEELHLSDRYDWIETDLTTYQYPENTYDLVLVAHVCRFIGDQQVQHTLSQLYKSLRSPGFLVIADVLLNEDENGPPAAVMLDLSMLVNTTQGRIRPVGTYRHWLEQAGFQDINALSVNGPFPLVVATKGSVHA